MIVKSIRPEVLTATRTAYWLAIDDAPEEQLVFIDKSSGIRVVERDRLAARVGRGTAATIARAVWVLRLVRWLTARAMAMPSSEPFTPSPPPIRPASVVRIISPVPPTVIDVKSRYGMVLTSCHAARGSGAYTWRSSFSKTR